jgi:hypothetical protein
VEFTARGSLHKEPAWGEKKKWTPLHEKVALKNLVFFSQPLNCMEHVNGFFLVLFGSGRVLSRRQTMYQLTWTTKKKRNFFFLLLAE